MPKLDIFTFIKQNKKISGILAIIIFSIFVILMYVISSSGSSALGYAFHQGIDSDGGDIMKLKNKKIENLVKWCNKNPKCKGFNSSGWMKHSLKPASKWKNFKKYKKSHQGLYIKKLSKAIRIKLVRKTLEMQLKVFDNQPEPTRTKVKENITKAFNKVIQKIENE